MSADELKAALRVVLPEVLRVVLPEVLSTLLPQLAENDPAHLLDIHQAAQRLRLGISTVRKLAGRCDVASVKSGRRLLFRPTDLDAYVEARRRSPERIKVLAERRSGQEK